MGGHDPHREWNHEIRQTLLEHGDDASSHHEITHYFYAESQEDADALLERLHATTHRILKGGEASEYDGREQWLVLTQTVTVPSEHDLDRMTDECCQLCVGLNVEYDGWETEIIKS